MQTIALEKAQATLADLIKQVADGEEFMLPLKNICRNTAQAFEPFSESFAAKLVRISSFGAGKFV